MPTSKSLIPVERIQTLIMLIRGQKVIIDADLAELYEVTTKRLNEQVRRNQNRFPNDVMFPLTKAEKQEVVAICDHLEKLKFSPALPLAFTEHGAIMAASVLNTPRAVEPFATQFIGTTDCNALTPTAFQPFLFNLTHGQVTVN